MNAQPSGRFTRSGRIARLLTKLLGAGAIAQVLNLVTGLALLRWLTVEEYAQYTVAFGFSATLAALVDLGFAGAIMPLVGDRASDRVAFGAYIRAALHLRARIAVVLLPISAVIFFVVTGPRDWGIGVEIGLFATIALTLLAKAMADIYSLPLLMHSRYREYYAFQVGTSGLRLAASAGLYGFRGLTGVTASAVSAVAALLNGLAYKRLARNYVDVPDARDPEKTRAIRRLMAPLLPGLIFTAFQGQITVLLITVFGDVRAIAEVGALSRLAALFAVLAGLNQVLIAPRFPQVPRDRLRLEIMRVLGGVGALSLMLTVLAFVFPAPLLFLLGSSYDHLSAEVAWFMLGASLGYLAGTIYFINVSRRFVWHWTTWLGLGLVIFSQVASAIFFDLGSVLGLQYFAALTGVAGCIAQAVTMLYGLRVGSRRP